jgi:hypothetical protein
LCNPAERPQPDLLWCSVIRLKFSRGPATAGIFFTIYFYFRLTGRRSTRFSPATDVVRFVGLIKPQTKSSPLETFKIK